MPAGIFGVPQDNKTIIPSQQGEYYSDSFHKRNMKRVSYGTLSEYRSPSDAIEMSIHLGKSQATIKDNYISVVVEAESFDEAFQKVKNELDRFCQHLSLKQRRIITYKNVIIEDDTGKAYTVGGSIVGLSVTMYNLKNLRQNITEVEKYHTIIDERLQKALDYYEQALLLYEKRQQIAEISSRFYMQIIASVYINLAKAVSTVLGDKRIDKDHKFRYKRLGIDEEFYKVKVRQIHKLRNNYGVAHYSLDDNKIKEIEDKYGESIQTVVDIIIRYRDYLSQHESDNDPI